jgi:hypothetical protein
VSYTGFAAGESAADLTGVLAYGGSSQGATAPGNYLITPGGLSAANYTLVFLDGVLNLVPASHTPDLGNNNNHASTIASAIVSALDTHEQASESNSSNLDDTLKEESSIVENVECGMKIPAGMDVDLC